MYKLFHYYSLLVFIFIYNGPEAPTRKTEALCLLAQGKKTPGRLFLSVSLQFLLVLDIKLTSINKQLTGLFILILRYRKIPSKMRMLYYLEELKDTNSYVQWGSTIKIRKLTSWWKHTNMLTHLLDYKNTLRNKKQSWSFLCEFTIYESWQTENSRNSL